MKQYEIFKFCFKEKWKHWVEKNGVPFVLTLGKGILFSARSYTTEA